MSVRQILIDSNAYFRLAQHVHPLLKTPFGKENNCLYVIKDLQREYNANPRLKRKFDWVNSPEYVDNRDNQFNISKDQEKDIKRALEFVENEARNSALGVSRVDIRYIAKAYVFGIPITTDANDMIQLAKMFNVKTLRTLELLKMMYDSGHVSIGKVKEIVSYWVYYGDMPSRLLSQFKRNFKRLFNTELPEL